jgi:hypothetical protein
MPYVKVPYYGLLNAATYTPYSIRLLGQLKDTDRIILNRNGADYGICIKDFFTYVGGGGGGGSISSTDQLPEGSVNKYYTVSRFNTQLGLSSIKLLQDVLYSSIPANAVLAWDTSISKWTAISITSFIQDITNTDNVTEGTNNLYYTNQRVSNFLQSSSIDLFGDVNTSNKTQGSILAWNAITQQWTAAIFNAVTTVNGLGPGAITLSTSNIAQGTNLYATTTNVRTILNSLSIDDFPNINLVGNADGRVLTWVASEGQFRPLDPALFTLDQALDDLSDVTTAGVLNNQVLRYSSSTQQWSPATIISPSSTDDLPEGLARLYFTNSRVDTRVSQISINTLADVSTVGAVNGSILTWNSATNNWVANQSYTPTSLNALSDVSYTPAAILNNQVLAWNSTTSKFQPANVLTEGVTTSNVPEGTNLYFTDSRVDTRIAQTSINSLSDVAVSPNLGDSLVYTQVSGSNQWRAKALALNDLTDVIISVTPTQGQTLIYDSALQSFLPASGSLTDFNFTYLATGDNKGIFYFLGTTKYRKSFSNPTVQTSPYTVTVILSSNLSGEPPKNILDRTYSTYIQTLDAVNSSILFDFGSSKSITPTYYTMVGRLDLNINQIRSWQLQGSNDSTTWTVLDTRTNFLMSTSQSFNGSCSASQSYRYIRIVQTSLNSSSTNNLCISEVEFYGQLSISGDVPILTTDDLPEGDINLYFSNANFSNSFSNSSIGSLTNVDLTGIQADDILAWDGASFIPVSLSSYVPTSTDTITEGTINLYYTNARVTTRINATSIDALSDVTLSSPSSNQTLIYSGGAFVNQLLNTSIITEGTNLYYTNARVATHVNTLAIANFGGLFIGTPTTGKLVSVDASGKLTFTDPPSGIANTDSLIEGSNNLYYTNARVATHVNTLAIANFGGLFIGTPTTGKLVSVDASGKLTFTTAPLVLTNTDTLTEGTTNLYYTNARVATHVNTLAIANFGGLFTGTPTTGKLVSVDASGKLTFTNAPTVLTNTDGLIEGTTNLYYTQSRVDTRFNTLIASTSIDTLSDVNLTGIQTGQTTVWDGTNLIPTDLPDISQASVTDLSSTFTGSATSTSLVYATSADELSFIGLNYLGPATYVDLTSLTTYTLQPSDHGCILVTSSTITITLPAPSILPTGFQCTLYHTSTNTVTIETIAFFLSSGTTLSTEYTAVYLSTLNSTTWISIGPLE